MPSPAELLADAVRRRDADDLEDHLDEAWSQGLGPEVVPALCAALQARWHARHEDIALALQELRAPGAVAALFETARSDVPYTPYDYSDALARKCCWALADTGTQEARAALGDLVRDARPVVAGYAQRRLDRWELELDRKA